MAAKKIDIECRKYTGKVADCHLIDDQIDLFKGTINLQTIHMLVAGGILILVLALIIIRPRNIGVAWPAGIGAICTIVAGLISLSTLKTIFDTTWNASATLIGLFLLSEALESNGFFTWAALLLARYARGSGWRLYMLMLVLTTAVTALLANDGAVLMLTPIFAALITRVYAKQPWLWLAFFFATGFFTDAMSTLLVPSNLTNIIIADATHLEFIRVAQWMLLPTLAAFAAGTLAFGLRFRKQFSTTYDVTKLEKAQTAIRDRKVFWAGWIVLGGLLLGYIVSNNLKLPISLLAGTAALIMVMLTHFRHLRSMKKILLAAPWSILIYAIGMFVVITAAFQEGILTLLTQPLSHFMADGTNFSTAVAAGSLLAGLSAGVNNLPATLIGVLVLHSAPTTSSLAVYATIIGVDIGPKFTPYGSLATLLWIGILARHNIHISWRDYFRENWWVTIIVLGAAFVGLLLARALFH